MPGSRDTFHSYTKAAVEDVQLHKTSVCTAAKKFEVPVTTLKCHSEEIPEIRKPKCLNSGVWNHFTKEDNGQKGKCNYCKVIISIPKGSTSNILRHLRTIHPAVSVKRGDLKCRQESRSQSSSSEEDLNREKSLERLEVPASNTLPSSILTGAAGSSQTNTPTVPPPSMSPLTVLSPSSLTQLSIVEDTQTPIYKSQEIDIQLLKMLCAGYHPFSLVEGKEFIDFVKMLYPKYHLPNCDTLLNTLFPSIYDEAIEKITETLEKVPAICLTCDGQANDKGISLYALTAHYFDGSTHLKSALLECTAFQERHTSKKIVSWIIQVINKFKINYKICAVVCDDNANIMAAVKHLDFRHLSCFAAKLNLIVERAIAASVKATVEKVRAAVLHFKQNKYAKTNLSELQNRTIKQILKLQEAVPTHWDYTFNMLAQFCHNQKSVTSALITLGFKIDLLPSDWTIIEQSVEILRTFYEVTIEISCEKQASLSKTCIFVSGLHRKIKKVLENTVTRPEVMALCQSLSEGLKTCFEKRETEELVAQSIFLDPRFKKQGFEEVVNFQEAYKTIVGEVTAALVEQSESLELSQSASSSAWDFFDESVTNFQVVPIAKLSAILEVNKYIAEQLLPRTMDPVIWWEERKQAYPNLHSLMLKRLCIPATSRLYALLKAEQFNSEKQSIVTPSEFTKMVFINSNKEFV